MTDNLNIKGWHAQSTNSLMLLILALLLLSFAGKSSAARIYNFTGDTVRVCKGIGILGKVASGGDCINVPYAGTDGKHYKRSGSLKWDGTNAVSVVNKDKQTICSLDFGVHAQIQGGNYMVIREGSCKVYNASKNVISTGSVLSYPYVKVKNNSVYHATGTVKYLSLLCKDDQYSVAPGKTWYANSRGACLVGEITSKLKGKSKYGEKTTVVPYKSSGTSYSQFQLSGYGGAYRVFSKQEYSNVTDTKRSKSPGFYLVNKTPWPVAYSLDQYSCLYHGIVPAQTDGKDGVMKVDTGAVWFTLRTHVQPDGIDPKDDLKDCALPVAELVADVAIAALTGGSSAVAKNAAKTSAKIIAEEAAKAAAKAAAKGIIKKMVKDFTKEQLGKLFSLGTSVELYGQYAGYEWPFRCHNMPEYHISGGPLLIDEDGNRYLSRGAPFTVKKVNTCGNDMMVASKKKGVADQGIFKDLPLAQTASDMMNKGELDTAKEIFKHYPSHSITGYNDKTIGDFTHYQCKQACLNEKSFSCKSFDYGNKNRTCYLSTKSGIEKPNDGTYDYFELIQ